MNWLKQFMVGRYGGDQLSVYLIILSIILIIIARVTDVSILVFASYIPTAIVIYRTFSKDLKKRSMENYKFAILISPLYSRFNKIKNRFRDSKKNTYFKCSKCKTTLRVPKGKGKIMITCPNCKGKTTKKT